VYSYCLRHKITCTNFDVVHSLGENTQRDRAERKKKRERREREEKEKEEKEAKEKGQGK
jgi:hypothetical protein